MRYLVTLLVLCLLYSCANQTAPTGGPKDEDPPELISSSPTDQDIEVKEPKITLEFNEYVKLNKASEQIIISPKIDNELEFSSRKNLVFIEFENDLPDSTTFTINLREGVQDITEGNSPENFKLAFSTGPYLDSLKIKGLTENLLTQEPSKDYSIFLYDASDTTNIFEDPPLYFTKTDEKGNFLLTNLKYGQYDIYAVEDLNKNLLLDFKSESYAFLDSTLSLRDTVTLDVQLNTYYLNALPIELKSARQNGTIFEIKYEKFIQDYDLLTEDTVRLYSNFLDDKHRSIVIYNHEFPADSLLTYINVVDSLGYNRQDTIYIKYRETVRKPKKLDLKTTINNVFPDDGLLSGELVFNKPIVSYNFDSLYLFLDSANIIPIDTSIILSANKYQDRFTLSYNIPTELFSNEKTATQSTVKKDPKKLLGKLNRDSLKTDTTSRQITPPPKPHLYIGVGAFVSVDYDSIQQEIKNLKFSRIEDFAILFIEVETMEKSFIVQLLDTKFNVLKKSVNDTDFSFDKLSPGEYYLRVIIDKNSNGKWDTGDIYTRTPPEPLFFYETSDENRKIILRANWETPITLTF